MSPIRRSATSNEKAVNPAKLLHCHARSSTRLLHDAQRSLFQAGRYKTPWIPLRSRPPTPPSIPSIPKQVYRSHSSDMPGPGDTTPPNSGPPTPRPDPQDAHPTPPPSPRPTNAQSSHVSELSRRSRRAIQCPSVTSTTTSRVPHARVFATKAAMSRVPKDWTAQSRQSLTSTSSPSTALSSAATVPSSTDVGTQKAEAD